MIKNVYFVGDCLKLYLEQSSDKIIQNMFCNRWKQNYYGGNLFLFAPRSVVIYFSRKYPGSMHQSIISEWEGIYKRLEIVSAQT